MNSQQFSSPLELTQIQVTDPFWKQEMELVRQEVIPYQWEALNDRIEGASPSFCIRNFQLAAKLTQLRRQGNVEHPVYPTNKIETLPDPDGPMEDRFYGFLFQDSDVFKWIEAVGYSLAQHPDSQLEAIADEAIDLICSAQQDNGYLDTFYIINDPSKIFSNLKDNHELYCFGHLTEGAVAYYQATGKKKLLTAAERYADYIRSYFGPDGCHGYPGHEIAEMALVRLYEVTGKEDYLELSRFFVDQRGTRPYYYDQEHRVAVKEGDTTLHYSYQQAHLPVREQDEAVGHAVRAVYLYSGMADLARLTGDESLFLACQNLWNSMVNEKMYVTGGIGGTHIGEAFSFPYDLPNDTAYAETCASIGLVFFARRMLQIKPDSQYGDVMERALYNGILSGMALDGKSFFYVNPLEVLPEACHKDARKEHVEPVRQKWFGCACCPPNLARLISSIGSYAFTQSEQTLFVHLYLGGMIQKQIAGETAVLKMDSQMPWSGTVSLTVEQGVFTPFTMAFRIPEWCDGNYTVQAGENTCQEVKDGYVYLTRNWNTGDQIQLDFEMNVRFLCADDRVREDEGKVCVTRGPVVYCMEQADVGENLHQIRVDPEHSVACRMGDICGVPAMILETSGWKKKTQAGSLYRRYEKPVYEPKDLTFIPYSMWANRGEGEMCVWIQAI
ncbi:MAG: glycoside hydrolase family 127 protein [Massiliimalia sp.]|jgi:DUF1680 family protein